MDYEDFKRAVAAAAEQRVTQGNLIPIPDLRRAMSQLDAATFDQYVLQLHAEGKVHLMSHVEPDQLTDEVKAGCLQPSSGPRLYWLRWL